MFENYRFFLAKLYGSPSSIGDDASVKTSISYNTFKYNIVFTSSGGGQGGSGGKLPGFFDTPWGSDINIDDIVSVFVEGVSVPTVRSKQSEKYTIKYGKTKKGRESQIDIDRTMEKKLERLVVKYGSFKEAVKRMFSDPFDDEDLVFNRFEEREKYFLSNNYAFIMDLSGSVPPRAILIDKTLFYIYVKGLSQLFESFNIFMGAHQTTAWNKAVTIHGGNVLDYPEVREYLALSGGGGTSVSEVIQELEKWMEETEDKIVLFYSGDLEVGSSERAKFFEFLEHPKLGFKTIVVHNIVSSQMFEGINDASIILDQKPNAVYKDPMRFIRFAARHMGVRGIHKYEE